MSSFWDYSYLVVDVETTGSHTENNRIVDLGCILIQDGEIAHEYTSMVNPHQFIPPFISSMTGITNEMAYASPESSKVISEILSFLPKEKLIFVAHNVTFDWKFFNNMFLRNNTELNEIQLLCTLKLAKKVLPNNVKFNVGALAKYFDIRIMNRHRAYDDAKATALVLLELMELAQNEHNISSIDELLKFQNHQTRASKVVSAALDKLKEKIELIPDLPGVYYFKDKFNKILYVGKAKSLKKRVNSYFHRSEPDYRKITNMLKNASKIEWIITESELHALLLESTEIKRHNPEYNSLDKRYRNFPFIKFTTDEKYPRLIATHKLDNSKAEYYGPFRNPRLVAEIVKTIDNNFKLRKCDYKLDQRNDIKPCIYHQMDNCTAPCDKTISIDIYKAEVDKVRTFLTDIEKGIIKDLSDRMNYHADRMEFELAAEIRNNLNNLKQILTRYDNIPPSINKNNIIVINLNDYQGKTLDLFFIRAGKLIEFKTIGQHSDLTPLNEIIYNIYFSGNFEFNYTIADIDHIKIVSSWLYKNIAKTNYINVDSKPIDDVIYLLEEEVKYFPFEVYSADKPDK